MAEQALITDKMKKAVGVPSEPVTYDIEQGLIRQFAQAIGDPSPQWQDEVRARETPNGGIVAPPTFLRTCNPKELDELKFPVTRGLDGGSEWEYFVPIRPGDSITVTQKIGSFTEKHGRLGAMLIEAREVSYLNQLGELVATQKIIGIYY